MSQKQIRCAIYTRKSSDEGLDQDYNSLDAQYDACRAYIKSQKQNGWVLYRDRFDDGAISGGTLERPGLKRLLEVIERGAVDVIVVYKIDRLTRSLMDFAKIVERLDARNASFVSVTQQFNTTTSMGRLTLNILLSFAQFEREVTSERIRDKIAASKKKGIWMGGFPPLGYDVVDRKLVINKGEARSINTIFKLAVTTRSLTELEQTVKARGIKNKSWRTQSGGFRRGAWIGRSSLRRILSNPVYIGKTECAGKFYDGEHQSIIDDALWDDVQSALADRAQVRRKQANASQNAPLHGRLFDDAGNAMAPSYVMKEGKIAYRYYVSKPALRGNKEQAGHVNRVNAAWLEDRILEGFASANLAQNDGWERDFWERIERVSLTRNAIAIEWMDPNREIQKLSIAAKLEKASHRRRIIVAGGRHQKNDALIMAVAKAHSWRQRLETGATRSIKAIADEKGLSERYVWKILRLAYLAPDIVTSILEGRQPPGLTLRKLNETALSPDWRLQGRLLGFAEIV